MSFRDPPITADTTARFRIQFVERECGLCSVYHPHLHGEHTAHFRRKSKSRRIPLHRRSSSCELFLFRNLNTFVGIVGLMKNNPCSKSLRLRCGLFSWI